jgi:hypothetical protein
VGDGAVTELAATEATLPLPLVELHVVHLRLRLGRRIAWLQEIAALYDGTDRLQGLLDDRDTPEAELQWQSGGGGRDLTRSIAEVDAELARRDRRLQALTERLQLNAPQRHCVETALALDLDPDLADLMSLLGRRTATGDVFDLIARLFGIGRTLRLSVEAPLFAWGLVVQGEAGHALLRLDPFIRNWLSGADTPDAALASCSALVAARPPLDELLGAQAQEVIRQARARRPDAPLRLLIAGERGSGRKTLAAWLAQQNQQALLAVQLPRPAAEAAAVQRRAQRYARLTQVALAYEGPYPPVPALESPEVLEFVIAGPDARLAAVEEPRIDIPPLTTAQRGRVWSELLPATQQWSESERAVLAGNFAATVGDVAEIARLAPAGAVEAMALLRRRRRGSFGRLATRWSCELEWSDLVVEPAVRESLAELTFEAQARRWFWDNPGARRLFPQGRALIAIFAGPSGTGKTMAAQLVARELGVELVRADLSTLTSKYIGQTAKNISRVLRQAAHADVVLLFDEADALFARRTELRDAHDRHANTDTNFLLQAIESHDGIVLLATNQKAHVDPAFIRRFRFSIEFTRPSVELRHELWRKIVSGLAGEPIAVCLNPWLRRLSANVETTGAQIKSATLSAVLLAARDRERLSAAHLLRGLERELAKEGQLLSGRERQRLLDDAA